MTGFTNLEFLCVWDLMFFYNWCIWDRNISLSDILPASIKRLHVYSFGAHIRTDGGDIRHSIQGQADGLVRLGRLKRRGLFPNLVEVGVYFEEDEDPNIQWTVNRVKRAFRGTGVKLQ